ncbi:Gfo/Idh/MocA family oxidoreductase [Hwanghaeella grinnelliae]|uniref:Gfo/Idh/MocA family oxidoreductase n=2 Tax=Hwanghaeella grinnelliae TaxID=2500179 RepID=A0A437QZ48_9PROT|nr:Gfo/Idh/MocA family oxidoreductase [Hwanghaeella grinnelliae]
MAAMKLGIIGVGIMGERVMNAVLRHDPSVVELGGIWDPSGDTMARIAAEHPTVPVKDGPDAVIASSDCLYIASPPVTHLDYARRAMEKGLSVLTEKPLAVDLGDAVAFVDEVEERKARAAVNFIFASSPGVEHLRRWIAEGAVGQVESLTIDLAYAAWPRPWQMDALGWLDKREQGGFTREIASHFLFLTRRLVGPIVLKSASATYPDGPDGDSSETAISAEIEAGGIPVTLKGSVATTDKPDHCEWTLKGRDGSVRLADWTRGLKLGADGEWEEHPDCLPLAETRPILLKGQLDKLAALTAGTPLPEGAFPLATVQEALEVQRMVETILASG